MNWRYSLNGPINNPQREGDGIVLIQKVLRSDGQYGWAPLIIGKNDTKETDKDERRLPRIIRKTMEEARDDIYSWKKSNGYFLFPLD